MKKEPLKSRTMSLEELQQATLSLIRKTRKQLNRAHWQDGMSDSEFCDKVLDSLATQIRCDIDVLAMHKNQSKPPHGD